MRTNIPSDEDEEEDTFASVKSKFYLGISCGCSQWGTYFFLNVSLNFCFPFLLLLFVCSCIRYLKITKRMFTYFLIQYTKVLEMPINFHELKRVDDHLLHGGVYIYCEALKLVKLINTSRLDVNKLKTERSLLNYGKVQTNVLSLKYIIIK